MRGDAALPPKEAETWRGPREPQTPQSIKGGRDQASRLPGRAEKKGRNAPEQNLLPSLLTQISSSCGQSGPRECPRRVEHGKLSHARAQEWNNCEKVQSRNGPSDPCPHGTKDRQMVSGRQKQESHSHAHLWVSTP